MATPIQALRSAFTAARFAEINDIPASACRNARARRRLIRGGHAQPLSPSDKGVVTRRVNAQIKAAA